MRGHRSERRSLSPQPHAGRPRGGERAGGEERRRCCWLNPAERAVPKAGVALELLQQAEITTPERPSLHLVSRALVRGIAMCFDVAKKPLQLAPDESRGRAPAQGP